MNGRADAKNKKMFKAALAGGGGFIGREVAQRLAGDYEIDVWELPDADVRRPDLLAKKFAAFQPQAVINLAGILGGVNSQNVREIFETNFVGNLNLLEQCVAHGVKKFVFASSLTVHGQNEPAYPNILSSPFRPIHAYGASKAASEYALQEYARRFGMSAVAIRPTMVLGDTATPHAPIEFIRALIRGEEPIIFGTGEHEREWIWIDDAAWGFRRALEFAAASPAGFYPFFLSGNRMAMAELARICVDRLGGKVRFEPSAAKAFTLTCDMTESEAMLGWRTTTGISTMIERLIDIQRAKISVQ